MYFSTIAAPDGSTGRHPSDEKLMRRLDDTRMHCEYTQGRYMKPLGSRMWSW